MTVFWLEPWSWIGLAALILPLLVHVLVRPRSRRVPFPSLRFLHTSRLSALRHWKIADWPLLLLRMSVLAMAVAALAAPVFVSADRERAWAARIARAVVVVGATPATSDAGEAARLAADKQQAASFAREFAGPLAATAGRIRDAVTWLEQQPPAAREVVIIGDLRDGALTEGDLDLLPSHVGIRFLPIASTDPAREIRLEAIGEINGATRFTELRTTLEDGATQVEYRVHAGTLLAPIEVRAATAQQERVEAALRAVLKEGVVLPRQPDRRARIEFAGAPAADSRAIVRPPRQAWMRMILERLDEVRGGEHDGTLIVEAVIAGDHPGVVELISRVARAVLADDRRDLEPRRVPASTLAAWSRPAAGIPPDVKPGDEGDRRLIWLAVLVLLAGEAWVRRSPIAPDKSRPTVAEDQRSVA